MNGGLKVEEPDTIAWVLFAFSQGKSTDLPLKATYILGREILLFQMESFYPKIFTRERETDYEVVGINSEECYTVW